MADLFDSFINFVNEGDETQVKQLASLISNLNYKDSNGWTPLFWACAKGHLKITQYLLNNGCRIDEIDRYGRTVFDIAFAAGKMNVVKFLQEIFPKHFNHISYLESYILENDFSNIPENTNQHNALDHFLFGGA